MTVAMSRIKIKFWHYGIFVTALLSILLGYHLFYGDKRFFLTGQTSYGHYQIELVCSSCHSKSFNNKDDIQEACESCHAKELDRMNDSHPKNKFQDPRNAPLLAQLDARYCVTCHTEHKPEITRDSGVTIASDFCFHCHQSIADDRPSHKEFAFDSCADAGCHNYHDNSMLYEDFMLRHLDEPWILKHATLPARNNLLRWLKKNRDVQPLTEQDHNAPDRLTETAIVEQWSQSSHATTAVNCQDCHNEKVNKTPHWKLTDSCIDCHEQQAEQFKQSKHGMRLGLGLTPMTPTHARLTTQTSDQAMTCSSCHNPHSLDVTEAAVDSCLNCHKDEHSLNYKQSAHFDLWQKEVAGEVEAGAGVTCASCHLPRVKKGKKVTVDHNQSAYMRPSNKMLRKVCMNCHGMEFSLSALVDENLIKNNFSSPPDMSLKTIELLKERLEKRREHQNPSQ